MHSLSHRHLKHTDGKTIRKINLFYDGFSNFFSFLFYDFFFCSSFFFSLYSLSSREEALFLYINFPNQYFFHPTLLCHIFHSSSFRFSLLFYITDFLYSCEMGCFALYFQNYQALSSTSEARNKTRRASMRTILCDIRQGRKRLYVSSFSCCRKKRLSDGALCARDFRPSVFGLMIFSLMFDTSE